VEQIRVVFANICQGLISEGKKNSRDVFSRHWPSAYREVYAPLNPDIVCLAEAPIDDQCGRSQFLEDLARDLDGAHFQADVHERSWLVENQFYGSAIISKLKLETYSTFKLPNPRLEVDNPDGSHWVLHDKTVQCAIVNISDIPVRIFNLHYFPFHRFKKDINDPDLIPCRSALIRRLQLQDDCPTIVAGDFNNGNGNLRTSYPELFEDDRLTEAVEFGPDEFDDYYSGKYQLDHVLFTNRHFCATHTQIVRDSSDHRGILVDLEIKV
jgi:endonuclease/exonuclease/phosphatase family metal-dependent hydrolase